MAKKLSSGQATDVLTLLDERLKSLFGAALQDPDVDEHAKSLAGYLLRRLSIEESVEEFVPSPRTSAPRT
jgi:hypothetical protein